MTLLLPIEIGKTYRRRDGKAVVARPSAWPPSPGSGTCAYVGDKDCAEPHSGVHAFLDCGKIERYQDSPFDLVDGPLPALFTIDKDGWSGPVRDAVEKAIAENVFKVPVGFVYTQQQPTVSYAALRAAGWTDEQLLAWGHLSPAPAGVVGKDEPVLKPNALDTQEGGDHYRTMGLQPWQAFEHWLTPEQHKGYLLGTALAYLARYNSAGEGKGGMVDVKKARHCLQRMEEIDNELQKG